MSIEDYIKQIEEYTEKRGESKNYNKEYLNFDIANKIKEIPDKDTKIKVALYYIDRMKEVPSLTDLILSEASQEQIPEIVKIYQENGIYVDADEYKVDSIEMKIAETAAKKYGENYPKNLVEAKRITDGSEVSAVRGIISALSLNEEDEKYLLDDVYHETKVSDYMASQIKEAIIEDKNGKILEILSTIHDGWVISNSDNFLKPGRDKERQFVPLEMLNWGEVENDLLFLKPILEAAEVEIDESTLKADFEIKQKEYFEKNNIHSHKDLVNYLTTGANFYPILDGRETINGGYIEELLKNPEIAERMAKQIESKVYMYPEIEESFNNIEIEEIVENTEIDLNQETIITSEDIARDSKRLGIRTKEVGFWGKVVNKLKELFKGIGEK